MTHHHIVTQVASSLNSPYLPTRKLLLELLSFLVYWNDGDALCLVLAALEALSASNSNNSESSAWYDYWFNSMESALSGRGKMGSLVGASEEVRKARGIDSSLNDYAVSFWTSVLECDCTYMTFTDC
jgi:cytokinesis protein